MGIFDRLFKIVFRKRINRIYNALSHFFLKLPVNAGRIPTSELVIRIFDFCELSTGKTMYPYQEQFSKRVIRSVLENDGEEITALFARQSGKCFAKGTEILMYDGSIKKVEDVEVGDKVMRPDSTPAVVTSLCGGIEEMYEVKSREKNHESFVVNKSHILSVVDRKKEVSNFTVSEYLKLTDWNKKDNYRGYRVPVEYPEVKTPVEPYFFGAWLGDGSSYDVHITNMDEEVIAYLQDYADRLGMRLSAYNNTVSDAKSYAIVNINPTRSTPNFIRSYFKTFGGAKRIPKEFMVNSRKVRLEVLAGIIDTDGHFSQSSGKENTLEVTFRSKELASDTLRLIRSLGFRASMREKEAVCTNNGSVSSVYRINAYGDFSVVPTKVLKKQKTCVELRENPLTFGFDLIPLGIDEYYGFTIDSPDKLFLLGDYTVTHNSEAIAVTSGGMMIILPILARMPMFAGDNRLAMFQDGFWIGIFAPSQRQAQITYGRIKSRIQSKAAHAVLTDPEFNLSFTTSNGQTVSLSHGSFATAISASDGSNIEGESFKLIILEECQDISNFKIRKEIHPMGAAYNATIVKIGTATSYKGDFFEAIQRNKSEISRHNYIRRNHFEYNWEVVIKYNKKYEKYIEKEKKRLGENSDEFQMSYNLKWIIERGMFIDIDKFERDNTEPGMDIVLYDKTATHVVGIDVGGKGNDSTVVTVTEVDWDMPVIQETNYNEETNEDETYYAFNTYVKGWLEIIGVPDYEEQYYIIMDYLKNFRIARILIDSTRESAIADRIKANSSYEVIPFVFSQRAKSDIYKHLDREIIAGRVRLPASESARASSEYNRCLEQLGNLQKGYSGANMIVAHSGERDAHDDYPDSLALAVYGCSFIGDTTVVQTYHSNTFTSKTNNEIMATKMRNRLTARRR